MSLLNFNEAEARALGYTGPADVGSFLAWRRDHPEQVNQEAATQLDAAAAARNAHEGGRFSGLGPAVRIGAGALMGGAAGAGLGGAAAAGGTAAGEGVAGGAAAEGAAFAMPAAVAETPSALAGMGLVESAPGVFGAGAAGDAGAFAGAESLAGPATGTSESAPAIGGAGAPEMLSAASSTMGLSPETAAFLGLGSGELGGFGTATGFDTAAGVVPGGAPTFGSEGFAQYGYSGEVAADTMAAGNPGDSFLDQGSALLKKMGLTPATAGLLGISGLQALSKPKLPQAQKDLQAQAGPAAAQANSVISSGGTGGPQWAGQKASIDATINQELKQQISAMTQQAVNSGQGADSQVTQQQINKLKDQLETARQQLYLQAQAGNVDAALKQLGISDAALANVSQTQFAQSNQAKSQAAQTASLALMLSAFGKG